MRVAILGGVPAPLGGGGLETQARQTAAALSRRGHEVFHIEREPDPRAFDLLHAFGANLDVSHAIANWRRNPAPLVLSPVIVVRPGGRELIQQVLGHFPIPYFGPRLRRDLMVQADLVVAQTEHEAHLARSWTWPTHSRVVTIPNGVVPLLDRKTPAGLPPGYVLLLGSVSARKKQQETILALGGNGIPVVVAGGFEGTTRERASFVEAVRSSGATWLEEVTDRAVVAGLLHGARALAHLSSAEGQSLAVIEALSVGTPAVLSPLPANRELGRAYPEYVRLADNVADIPAALAALTAGLAPAPIPSWDDIALRLEGEYEHLLASP